jgi:hypothetical protein
VGHTGQAHLAVRLPLKGGTMKSTEAQLLLILSELRRLTGGRGNIREVCLKIGMDLTGNNIFADVHARRELDARGWINTITAGGIVEITVTGRQAVNR